MAGLQIVQIQLSPVIAFREPDDFVRGRQVPPVHAAIARLEERRDPFFHDGTDRAGRRVGEAQLLEGVIPRSRDKGQASAVVAPLHVRPLSTPARHVVAQRGTVLIGIHLERHETPAVDLDHDTVNHGDDFVAGQRVLPRLERRMPDPGVDQIHLADVALILLKRGDLLRIRRPRDDRAIAACPSGIVGGVAEVLHAIGGERRFPARRDIAHPQVPVADEHRFRAVGRRRVGPLCAAASGRTFRAPFTTDRQIAGAPRRARRIDQHRLLSVFGRRPVPEAIVREPRRADAAVQNEWRRVVRHEPLGARVIRARERPRRLGGGLLRRDSGTKRDREQECVSH